jgi:hypothetical protein
MALWNKGHSVLKIVHIDSGVDHGLKNQIVTFEVLTAASMKMGCLLGCCAV